LLYSPLTLFFPSLNYGYGIQLIIESLKKVVRKNFNQCPCNYYILFNLCTYRPGYLLFPFSNILERNHKSLYISTFIITFYISSVTLFWSCQVDNKTGTKNLFFNIFVRSLPTFSPSFRMRGGDE